MSIGESRIPKGLAQKLQNKNDNEGSFVSFSKGIYFIDFYSRSRSFVKFRLRSRICSNIKKIAKNNKKEGQDLTFEDVFVNSICH